MSSSHSLLHPYREGQEIQVDFARKAATDKVTMSCTILKAFHPFTNSQVLKVSIRNHESVGIPQLAAMKLLDRRFLERTTTPKWNPAVEPVFRKSMEDIKAGLIPCPNTGTNGKDWDYDEDEGTWPDWWHEKRVYIVNCHLFKELMFRASTGP